jgi:hypothetical protein
MLYRFFFVIKNLTHFIRNMIVWLHIRILTKVRKLEPNMHVILLIFIIDIVDLL